MIFFTRACRPCSISVDSVPAWRCLEPQSCCTGLLPKLINQSGEALYAWYTVRQSWTNPRGILQVLVYTVTRSLWHSVVLNQSASLSLLLTCMMIAPHLFPQRFSEHTCEAGNGCNIQLTAGLWREAGAFPFILHSSFFSHAYHFLVSNAVHPHFFCFPLRLHVQIA